MGLSGGRSSEPAHEGGQDQLVTVGILTFNRAWSLPEVLESLIRFEYDQKLIRIIFVDNESTDGTRQIIDDFVRENGDRYESVKVIVTRSGISKARNICIDQALGTGYLFFLDSDVAAGRETVRRLLAHVKGSVGVSSFPYDSENSPGKFGVLVRAFNTPTGPADANKVAAGCTLFDMKVVQKVGRFNEGLRVLEDGEYCYRVRSAGFRIICDFSYPARHLHKIQMDAGAYLGFVRDSAAYYVALAREGSLLYAARLLLSVLLAASFLLAIAAPATYMWVVFGGALIAGVIVNSSSKLWGDGSTIKPVYRPVVGIVFSAFTLLVTFASIGLVYRKLGGSSRNPRQ